MYRIRIIILLTVTETALSEIKTWKNTLFYNDIQNWNTRKVPYLTDRVVFPSEMEVPIILPKQTGLCELVFSENGDIVLEEESDIIISLTTMDRGCPGQESTFLKHEKAYWLDPANWESENYNSAVPHIERLPCSFDTVVFPSNSSFTTVLPSDPITLAGFEIAGKRLSQKDLKIMIQDELFGEEFTTDAGSSYDADILIISEEGCTDETGCACGNGQFYNVTCSFEKPRCQKQLNCFLPIKPAGHCCDVCGEYLLLTYDPASFKYKTLKNIINSLIEEEIADRDLSIDYHISKISDGQVHIFLVDVGEYDGQAEDIPAKIQAAILENKIGITEIITHSSGEAYNPNSWLSPKNVMLTALLVVLLCIIGLIIYYRTIISRSEKGYSFRFTKFENQLGEENDIEMKSERTGTSFINPMFETSVGTSQEIKPSEEQILHTPVETEMEYSADSGEKLIEITDDDDVDNFMFSENKNTFE